nr:hypothetical protein [Bradyrhizobium sp. 151]
MAPCIASRQAQAQFSEPVAFAAQYPDRDVLNAGALTPAGKMKVGSNALSSRLAPRVSITGPRSYERVPRKVPGYSRSLH